MTPDHASFAPSSTLEEEQVEVLQSVLEALGRSPDAIRAAACHHLLRHLTRTMVRR